MTTAEILSSTHSMTQLQSSGSRSMCKALLRLKAYVRRYATRYVWQSVVTPCVVRKILPSIRQRLARRNAARNQAGAGDVPLPRRHRNARRSCDSKLFQEGFPTRVAGNLK